MNIISALSAFCAAGLWWRSTVVKVLVDPQDNAAKIFRQEGDKMVDLIATQEASTSINNQAAKAASVAALCQGIVITIQIFT